MIVEFVEFSMKFMKKIEFGLPFLLGVMSGGRPPCSATKKRTQPNKLNQWMNGIEGRKGSAAAASQIKLKWIYLIHEIWLALPAAASGAPSSSSCAVSEWSNQQKQINQFINSKRKNWWNWFELRWLRNGGCGSSFFSSFLFLPPPSNNTIGLLFDWMEEDKLISFIGWLWAEPLCRRERHSGIALPLFLHLLLFAFLLSLKKRRADETTKEE